MSRVTVTGFTLVYDSDCRACTRFRSAIEFLDARNRIGYRSIGDADRQGLLDMVAPHLRHRSFHLVEAGGMVLSGAEAIPELIWLLPSGSIFSRLIVSAPSGRTLLALVYSTFARVHESGSCVYRTVGGSERTRSGNCEFQVAPPSLPVN